MGIAIYIETLPLTLAAMVETLARPSDSRVSTSYCSISYNNTSSRLLIACTRSYMLQISPNTSRTPDFSRHSQVPTVRYPAQLHCMRFIPCPLTFSVSSCIGIACMPIVNPLTSRRSTPWPVSFRLSSSAVARNTCIGHLHHGVRKVGGMSFVLSFNK